MTDDEMHIVKILVRDAYNEAFREGMREHTSRRGDNLFDASMARHNLSIKLAQWIAAGSQSHAPNTDANMAELKRLRAFVETIEGPKPLTTAPYYNAPCYLISDCFKVHKIWWNGGEDNTKWLSRGIVFGSLDDASAAANAQRVLIDWHKGGCKI